MKVKLSQGELKRMRDALRQYERYLPTLQLKKQQLQLEIVHLQTALSEVSRALAQKEETARGWAGLLGEMPGIAGWLTPVQVVISGKNIAGVDIPLYECVEFGKADYDLFLSPPWLDGGLIALREIVSLREEADVIRNGIAILSQELRITTQRVNLFEKVKIPEAKEAIRLIKIHLGDQMTNAVGRSKIAKKKIEESNASGVA